MQFQRIGKSAVTHNAACIVGIPAQLPRARPRAPASTALCRRNGNGSGTSKVHFISVPLVVSSTIMSTAGLGVFLFRSGSVSCREMEREKVHRGCESRRRQVYQSLRQYYLQISKSARASILYRVSYPVDTVSCIAGL